MEVEHDIMRLIVAYPMALRGVSQGDAPGDCTLSLGNKGVHLVRCHSYVLHLYCA